MWMGLTNHGEQATGDGGAGNEEKNDDSQECPRTFRVDALEARLGFGRHVGDNC